MTEIDHAWLLIIISSGWWKISQVGLCTLLC